MKLNRKLGLQLGICGLAAASVMTAQAEPHNTLTVETSMSGWSLDYDEADLNGDLQGGKLVQWFGTVRGLGAGGDRRSGTQIGQQNDVAPWDGSTFCKFDDAGNPVSVEIGYLATSFVQRFSNTDLIYQRMASSPPSTLCYSFVDGSYTGTLYYDVSGGTGRFAEAEGQTVMTFNGNDLGDGTFSGAVGKMRSEIRNVRNRRHQGLGHDAPGDM